MSIQENNKKQGFKINWVIVIMVVLVVLFGGRIALNIIGKQEIAESQGVPVEIAEISNSNFEKYFEIYGSALAETEVTIITKMPAIVESVRVKPGDQVNQGDTLFVLSTEDLESSMKQSQAAYEIAINNAANTTGVSRDIQIKQQEASLKSAEINYKDAQDNLDRMKSLYEAGGVSKREVESIENSYTLAKHQYELALKNYEIATGESITISDNIVNAQLKQAEAGLDATKKQYNDMVVKSDIKGEVGISKVSVGEVSPAQGIAMTVVDYSNIIFELAVTEDKISKISKTSKCEVRFSALEDRVFVGQVISVSPSIDPQTRLYQVQIKVNNQDKAIKPGMSANIKIYEKSVENNIVIPIDAIMDIDGEDYVYLARDSKAIIKKVEVLDKNSRYALIGSGVNLGDKLIVKGQDYVADGDLINIAG